MQAAPVKSRELYEPGIGALKPIPILAPRWAMSTIYKYLMLIDRAAVKHLQRFEINALRATRKLADHDFVARIERLGRR